MGRLYGRLSTECSAKGVPNIRIFYESFLVKIKNASTLPDYQSLCYVMLCYVMLCYVMLCYVMSLRAF
jgi:hypothetical protein